MVEDLQEELDLEVQALQVEMPDLMVEMMEEIQYLLHTQLEVVVEKVPLEQMVHRLLLVHNVELVEMVQQIQ
jgi:hypothetical protein